MKVAAPCNPCSMTTGREPLARASVQQSRFSNHGPARKLRFTVRRPPGFNVTSGVRRTAAMLLKGDAALVAGEPLLEGQQRGGESSRDVEVARAQ